MMTARMFRIPPLSAALVLAGVLAWCPLSASAADASAIPELFESSFNNESQGEIGRALNDVLEILRISPDHYIGNLRAGWLYYLKGRYVDAITFYRKSAKLAPKAIEPKLGLMLPLMAAKRWEESEKVGKAVQKRAPENYQASSRLAFIAFSVGDYKLAETRYRGVLANYPSDIEMKLGLAWTLARQARKAEARAVFDEVLMIRQSNLSARAGLESL